MRVILSYEEYGNGCLSYGDWGVEQPPHWEPLPSGWTTFYDPAAAVADNQSFSADLTYGHQMACSPITQEIRATFYASTNKDVYSPGEVVTVEVVANVGHTTTMGARIENVVDVIINAIDTVFCWFGLGCDDDPPVVAAQNRASFNGVTVALADDGSGGASDSGDFSAPTKQETYTIDLVGCRVNEGCTTSRLTFSVNAPPPSVLLEFN